MWWADEVEDWNTLALTSTSPRRVGLKSGLLVGGTFSLVGGIVLVAGVVADHLSTSGATDAMNTVATLAAFAWLLLLLVHPVWASFIAVRHTRRLRSGLSAGIIAGCLYAFTSLVALAFSYGLGYGSAVWWLLPEVAIGLWLLPSAALAALGGLAANLSKCGKP